MRAPIESFLYQNEKKRGEGSMRRCLIQPKRMDVDNCGRGAGRRAGKPFRTAAGLAVVLLAAGALAACSDKNGEKDEGAVAPEAAKPVELVWYFASATSLTPEVLHETYVAPVQKKYPHISIQFLNNKDEHALANLVASQTKIDLIFSSFSVLNTVKQNGLLGKDISDLVQKHGFDLNRIEDSYLQLSRDLNGSELAALPLYDIRRVLFYNKDVFDKFGIGYPEDGMTWKQALDLARRLTRQDAGVQYRGLVAPPGGFVSTSQLSLPFLDPQTKKAALATDGWKRFFETYVPFYTMDGFGVTTELLGGSKQEDFFFKEHSAAMLAKFNSDANAVNNALTNWDAAVYPVMEGMEGVGSQPYPVYLAMSSTIQPEKRDAAFLVMQELLADEEQKSRSAQGLATPLKSKEVKDAFGQSLEVWKGKNFRAVSAQTPAPPVPYHDYNRFGQTAVTQAINSVILGGKDVNTALRDAEEQANKQIAQEESK